MTHKITAYVVDDEDIHPTHNPFSNAHAMSPELSKSKKRRARRTISDSGASKYMFSGKSWFRNYTPSHNVSIRVAEGSSAKALGTGDVGPLKMYYMLRVLYLIWCRNLRWLELACLVHGPV